jgi:hypothetical protein
MPDYELLHHCDHLTCWCVCDWKFCNIHVLSHCTNKKLSDNTTNKSCH